MIPLTDEDIPFDEWGEVRFPSHGVDELPVEPSPSVSVS